MIKHAAVTKRRKLSHHIFSTCSILIAARHEMLLRKSCGLISASAEPPGRSALTLCHARKPAQRPRDRAECSPVQTVN